MPQLFELTNDPPKSVPVPCVLGLGSNLPYGKLSPAALVHAAASSLRQTLAGVRLSPLYKTSPLHVRDQPPFINAALYGFFMVDNAEPTAPAAYLARGARRLLSITQSIEARYGRNRPRERRWGERSLDIDILLFGGLILDEDDLTIPHSRLQERAFALRPLLDLLPDAVEPISGRRYDEMLEKLDEQVKEMSLL